MDGYLLVNKPIGVTSFGVVARVRRVLSEQAGKKIKVGHTGTLDPQASGLMVLVVGSYCRRAQELSKLDKTYDVELMLGVTSSTDDSEGELTGIDNWRVKLGDKDIPEVISRFVGEIAQVPPIFSAIKVDGQRAYKLARKGDKPEMKPRAVRIYSINDIAVNDQKVTFSAHVSSGTYIRSLARDIGEALGCGAYMSALNRTSVGTFGLQDAIVLEDYMHHSDPSSLLRTL